MTQEVYFNNIQKKIIELIRSAEFDIKIAVAWFTDEYLINLLKNLDLSKITVTIIINNDKINDKNLFVELSKKNCGIYLSSKMMHNKFCIIDNKTVINGSYNWTNNAHYNNENITVTYDDLNYANNFIKEFNNIKTNCSSIDVFFKNANNIEYSFLDYFNYHRENYILPCFIKNDFFEGKELISLLNESTVKEYLWLNFKMENSFNDYDLKKYTEKYERSETFFRGKFSWNSYHFNVKSINHKYFTVLDGEFDENNGLVLKNNTYTALLKINNQYGEEEIIAHKIDNHGCVIEKCSVYKLINNSLILKKNENKTYHLYDKNLTKIINDLSSESIVLFNQNIICYKNEKLGVISFEGKVIYPFEYDRLQNDFIVKRIFPDKVFSIRRGELYSYKNTLNTIYGDAYKDEYTNLISGQNEKKYSLNNESDYIFIFDDEVNKILKHKNYFGKHPPTIDLLYSLESKYGYKKYQELLKNEDFNYLYHIQNELSIKEQNARKAKDRIVYNKTLCYIATMAYEDINHPKVQLFRDFRDDYLIKYYLGELFINKYYQYSPRIVEVLKPYKTLNKFIRYGLDLLIKILPTKLNN